MIITVRARDQMGCPDLTRWGCLIEIGHRIEVVALMSPYRLVERAHPVWLPLRTRQTRP